MQLLFVALLVVVAVLALLSALRDHFDNADRSKKNNTFPFIALFCALVFGSISLDLWKKDSETREDLSTRVDTLGTSIETRLKQYSEFGEQKHKDQILAQEKKLSAFNTGLDLLAKRLDEQTIALQELDALQKLVDSHLTKGRLISVPPAAQINVDDLVEFLASEDVWNLSLIHI